MNTSAPLSSLAAWYQLEAKLDRYASLGALAFAGVAAFLVLLIL